MQGIGMRCRGLGVKCQSLSSGKMIMGFPGRSSVCVRDETLLTSVVLALKVLTLVTMIFM